MKLLALATFCCVLYSNSNAAIQAQRPVPMLYSIFNAAPSQLPNPALQLDNLPREYHSTAGGFSGHSEHKRVAGLVMLSIGTACLAACAGFIAASESTRDRAQQTGNYDETNSYTTIAGAFLSVGLCLFIPGSIMGLKNSRYDSRGRRWY